MADDPDIPWLEKYKREGEVKIAHVSREDVRFVRFRASAFTWIIHDSDHSDHPQFTVE